MTANVVIHCRNVAGHWAGAFIHCYERARVFSPYITSSLAEQALEASWPHWIEVHTHFAVEAFAAGASSLATLKALHEKGYPLFSVPRLHAKVFDHPRDFATIGSQNLTQRGIRNREATVLIRDPELLAQLRRQLAHWIADRRPITMEMILETEAAIILLRKEFRRLQRACRQVEKQVLAAQHKRDEQSRLLKKQEDVALRTYQQELQQRLGRMGDGTSVPYDFCRSIAWNATEWRRQGRIVRSRRDADHLRTGPFGWEVPLGENRFGVELAVKWCREELKKIFPIEAPRPFILTAGEVSNLEVFVGAAIIGHRDKLYSASYRAVSSDGRVWLGNHAVNPANTVSAILHFAGFRKAKG
ncbi:MAG: phospholipase D-like domain-containing protein [Verrucomicrobiota bacterium]|nr:phospholipase D-like domain-containing protein [Verrucomicrobiota bacterium]